MSGHYKPIFSEELSRYVYSTLTAFFAIFMFLFWLVKIVLGKDKYGIKGLNRYGLKINPATSRGLLIHCVSVGEVVAASTLIGEMLRLQPMLSVTITTTTATGAKQVEQIFGNSVKHLYLPLDLPFLMSHLISAINPTQVVITEVELWPNLIHCCWKKQIPVSVINARMTNKSMGSYQKLSSLFKPMLSKLSLVCAQGQRDYNNYLELGIAEQKLVLTNNIKFDQALPQADKMHDVSELTSSTKRKILVAGSTHEPEEQALIDAYKKLKSKHVDLLLVLVPRHPQRFEKVLHLCRLNQVDTLAYSQNKPAEANTDVLVIDAMGMLNSFYAVANITFVGGSLADRGGHNALEPAAFAKPVLMGPHTYNNPVICQTLKDAGALILIADAQQIADQVEMWLNDDELCQQAGEAGRAVLQSNRGAVAKTINLLSSYNESSANT